MKQYQNNRGGFTLIELLVVIAIIAILAAILFPVFAQAKGAAKRTTSLSNVKNITMAQFLYLNDYDGTVAMNRDCNVFAFAGGPNLNPCVVGRGMRGWIDLTVPYVRNYGVFKSPSDSMQANPLPAGTLDHSGNPITNGLIWAPRPNGELFGGEYRSSYARNNNFANNGTYTANESQMTSPATTILIYSFASNSGAGAAGNEGVPGSSFTIVRRTGVAPDPGTCVAYDNTSTQNNRASFLNNLPAFARAMEGANPSSERYNGVAIYGFADGHAKVHRPERVRGQCNWGTGTGGVEMGNDGSTPDFRF